MNVSEGLKINSNQVIFNGHLIVNNVQWTTPELILEVGIILGGEL